jgi:hypothetical protein
MGRSGVRDLPWREKQRGPVAVGGGTPFLPPVTKHLPLALVETGRSARV